MVDLAQRNGKASKRVITKWSQQYDSTITRLMDSPSPEKFVALLNSVDAGELWKLCQLQKELERRSDQFRGVVQTRRNAIRTLDWCIDPDPKAEENDEFAKEVADYCSDRLTSVKTWSRALRHLTESIGPNLAAVELVWDKAEIVDFILVPYRRFASHPITNTGVVIRTDEEPLGYPTELFTGKFIVAVPNDEGGYPFFSTLTHASIGAYLMNSFSRKDWLAFSELYGTPWRVGTYDDAVVDLDRTTIRGFLDEGGTDTAIIKPKGVELDIIQASGTGETYQKQADYSDAKWSILWLGQTLTTDVGDSGSRALGDVHDRVRNDLRDGDIKSEAEIIREQLLRPMVELRFPGRDAPIPVFKRIVPEKRDIDSERLTLDQLRFMRESGLRIDESVIYEKFGLPRPEEAEVETEDDAVTVTFNELTLAIERAIGLGDLALVNALRSQIGKMLGVSMPDLAELPKKEVVDPGIPNNPDLTKEKKPKELKE